MYDLCVDNGKEVTRVEDDSTLSVVQPGTTVVMRIVLVKQAWRSTVNQRYVTFPGGSCGARTEVDDKLGALSIEWCALPIYRVRSLCVWCLRLNVTRHHDKTPTVSHWE